MDQMIEELKYGTTTLRYRVTCCSRKTLGIVVHPDGSIEVKAPETATPEQIRKGVHRRAAWICKQQRYFREFGLRNPKRQYVSGESHLYLGRQYMLRVVCGTENKVHYHSNILEVECCRKSDVKKLLLAWYRQRAVIKFHEYAEPLIEHFRIYGVQPSALEIRAMKTRWGSCSSKGKITLNVDLIRAPRICTEYVLIHELCHLVHKNHTKAYYELLAHEMPEWEKWKLKLEKMMM